MKQLQKRILLFLTLFFTVFSSLFFVFASSLIKEHSLQQQKNALGSELFLLESQLEQPGPSFDFNRLTTQLERASEKLNGRITFIKEDGTVLFDSQANINEIENHTKRSEFQTALQPGKTGSAIRKSKTTGRKLYYVATLLQSSKNEKMGVLRLSKSIDEMESLIFRIRGSLIVFICLAVLVAIWVTHYWSKRFSHSMQEIVEVTEELSKQNYHARYQFTSYNEIDRLGETINVLAKNLSHQMDEIKQNDRQLTKLVNNLVIGVMLLDDDRCIQMVNPVMEEMIGASQTLQKGTSYVHSLKNYTLIQLIEAAFLERTTQNKEINLYYPQSRIVDAHVVPYTKEQTNGHNAIVLLYDMSHIRKLEKVRSDFVANASHEMRTPLTALMGFSETLLDGAMEDQETLVEFLTIIQKESNRLDGIVRDILEVSKLENQAISFKETKMNVHEVVKESFQLLEKKAETSKIRLTLIGENPTFYFGDRDRLKQIIMNVIDNALSYTSEEGNVRVTLLKKKNSLLISIKDTGIGISQEEQERIFERFYRVDKARSRNSGGNGLGLSIVKHLVENFQGEIEVKSSLGEGTEFLIHLPNKDKEEVLF